MEKSIVGVVYKHNQTGEFGGKSYNYYCELAATIGDIVLAPTANGDSIARIVEINISAATIEPRVKPLLKTITAFAESTDSAAPSVPNGLITVKQLPVIEERLRSISDQIKERTQAALSLACTDETVKQIKAVRAELRRDYNALEEQRKAVRSAIIAPYEEFNEKYRVYVTDVFDPADAELKERVDNIEIELKNKKRDDVAVYFAEYAKSQGVDFVTFDRAGIQSTLSASVKGLKTQAKQFIDRVVEDLVLIATQPFKDEILVEYKKSLNVSTSVTTVCSRHAAIEDERRRREEAAAEKTNREASATVVQNIVREAIMVPPTAEPLPPDPEQTEAVKVYSASFKVRSSIDKLKALKKFLVDGGYEYESI